MDDNCISIEGKTWGRSELRPEVLSSGPDSSQERWRGFKTAGDLPVNKFYSELRVSQLLCAGIND